MEDGTLGICTIEGCVENQDITVSENDSIEGMVSKCRAINVLYCCRLNAHIKSYYVIKITFSSFDMLTQMNA